MAKRSIIVGVVTILVVGLIFLGVEVKKLRAEVTQLSGAPSSSINPSQQQSKQKFTPPDDWWGAFNNQWDPYSELAHIQRQMNRLFNETFRGGVWHKGVPADNTYELSSDIKENKDSYVISMDIPGMEKENINVEVKNNTLFVSGERKNENEQNNANYYRQERSFGYFSQSLPLPPDASTSGISVNYKNGVLTIEIPKLAKAETPQGSATKIKVN